VTFEHASQDKVWELDEGKVADVIKVALSKCGEALDALKERLPRSDMQRRELARGYVSGIMNAAQATSAAAEGASGTNFQT